MRIGELAFAAILLLSSGPGASASPMTLGQAVEKALANNKELQVKRLAIKTAESEMLKARLWSQSNPELEMEAVSDVLTGNSGEGTIQLGLSQEVELGGQRGHRTKIADAHIELVKLELTVSEQTLKRDVKAVFNALVVAQQRLAFSRYVDSLAGSLRDTAEVRVGNGLLPRSEYTFLDIDVASTQTTVNKADASLNENKTQLLRLLGGTPDNALEAVGEVAYQPLLISEDSVANLASIHRYELQENQLRQSATTAELGLARSERVPDLRVSAFYSRQKSVFSSSDFVGNSAGLQGLKATDHLIGVRFSLPLPLIDKHRSEIARYRSETEVNAATGQSLDNQIQYEARNAYRALKSAEKTLELLQQVQPESDSLFQLLQRAYAQGRVGISDYLTQKDRLLVTRLNLLDAYSNYVGAQKEVERAVGLDWNQIRQGELK